MIHLARRWSMANGLANQSPRDIRTICLPVTEERYREVVDNSQAYRVWLHESFGLYPELFPESFAQGFHMKDQRLSKKVQLPVRRIQLRDGTSYSIRPSFLMPFMSARTDEVENPLFLRKFGVPFWVLSHVFGHDPMYWFRLECRLGGNSIVGTTVRKTQLPEHLLADEHHQTCDGNKVYLATTVGG